MQTFTGLHVHGVKRWPMEVTRQRRISAVSLRPSVLFSSAKFGTALLVAPVGVPEGGQSYTSTYVVAFNA